MDKKSLTILFAFVFFITGVFVGRAAEKKVAFPVKPIRFIVPYAAGSGNDIQSRGIQPYLEKHLSGRIVIDNRPGADARLGLLDAWKAAPDGYTIINAGMPTPLYNEKMFAVNYRCREFTHIYAWSKDNLCVVVNAEVFKSGKDFINEARLRTLAGGLSGTSIGALSLAEAGGFKPVNWVPFKGGGETMTSLAGKHIDFTVASTSTAQALVNAGKLRIALIYADEKDPVFSEAPLPRDLGLKFPINLGALPIVRGVWAPPGMNPAMTSRLRQAFAQVVKDQGFLDWAKKARVEMWPMDGEQFLQYTLTVEKEVMKYIDKLDIKK